MRRCQLGAVNRPTSLTSLASVDVLLLVIPMYNQILKQRGRPESESHSGVVVAVVPTNAKEKLGSCWLNGKCHSVIFIVTVGCTTVFRNLKNMI